MSPVTLHARVRERLSDQRGIAMVTVVLMGAILFAVGAIVTARSFSDYNQVRGDRRFEQAIQVADSGVDHTLYKVGAQPSFNTGETVPGSPPGSFADNAAEQAWVLSAASDNPLVTTPEGQWAAVRPQNAAIIYSVGYIPTRANPYKLRIIRAAYDLAPFVPSVAILTDGDLDVTGDPMIDGEAGSAHANGDVDLTGVPSFSGYVSASGDYEQGGATIGDLENSGGGQPEREVPLIDPRENYVMSEYDLCADGAVRTGPSYAAGGGFSPNSTLTPCAGQTLADTSGGAEYRGWKKSGDDPSKGAKWDLSGNLAYDGVYYAYLGSVKISGNPGSAAQPWNLTIFAEASASSGGEPGHCPHTGGDIEISGNPAMRRHDKAQPLHLIAGRDLQLGGNPATEYEGVLASHEQFQISGNPRIRGVIIANDYCDTPGSPVNNPSILNGNPHITYDGGLEVPLGRRIRTTHWNEI